MKDEQKDWCELCNPDMDDGEDFQYHLNKINDIKNVYEIGHLHLCECCEENIIKHAIGLYFYRSLKDKQ